MNYIEWVDQVRQLLAAQWQRDPAPFALDVVRMLPVMQANTRTLDDRRAADPFMCASEDLIALGVLRLDEQHAQRYEYLGDGSPPAAPAPDARQAAFLAALIQRSQVVQGARVWLHWCGIEELCQALGWGPSAEVASLEAAIIGPLEAGDLIRSYPSPGEMRFRPTYQGIQATQSLARVPALTAAELARLSALGIHPMDLAGRLRLVLPIGCAHDFTQTRAILSTSAARNQLEAALQALRERGAYCDCAVFQAVGELPRCALWHSS